jgi:hypothetical protein
VVRSDVHPLAIHSARQPVNTSPRQAAGDRRVLLLRQQLPRPTPGVPVPTPRPSRAHRARESDQVVLWSLCWWWVGGCSSPTPPLGRVMDALGDREQAGDRGTREQRRHPHARVRREGHHSDLPPCAEEPSSRDRKPATRASGAVESCFPPWTPGLPSTEYGAVAAVSEGTPWRSISVMARPARLATSAAAAHLSHVGTLSGAPVGRRMNEPCKPD